VQSYNKKLSGPLLDRIDLKVMVSSVDDSYQKYDYATATFKKEISKARELQQSRFKAVKFVSCNADVPNGKMYQDYDPVDKDVMTYLSSIHKKHNIGSNRVQVKLLLVSRTIADLESANSICKQHVDLAVELMGLDDNYFKSL
jgi:magnesium chelatase family protein